MQRVEFSYSMKIEFSAPVVRHCFSLRCLPFNNEWQRIRELFIDVSPHNVLTETADGFGNRILTDRITEPHTLFSVYVNGISEIDLTASEAEPLNGIYKYPSQHTACGPFLTALAEAQRAACADAFTGSSSSIQQTSAPARARLWTYLLFIYLRNRLSPIWGMAITGFIKKHFHGCLFLSILTKIIDIVNEKWYN